MDEKKRIIEFDAASEVPVDGQMPIDSASQGTKKITPALLLKDITDLLGNAPLETQAQVLTAAVNEVNAKAAQATHLTQAEWDALPNTKYTDDVAYFITDGESTVGTALWTKVGTAGLNTNAKNCSGAINELKGTLDNNNVTLYEQTTYHNDIGGYITLSDQCTKYNILAITVYLNSISSATRGRFLLPVCKSRFGATYMPLCINAINGYVRLESQSDSTKINILSCSYDNDLCVGEVVGLK